MRRLAVMIAAIAVMGVFAQEALAQNAHLKGRNPIAFTDNGLTLSAAVSYAGLGNFDTLQALTASGGTDFGVHEPGRQPGTGAEPRTGHPGGRDADPCW